MHVPPPPYLSCTTVHELKMLLDWYHQNHGLLSSLLQSTVYDLSPIEARFKALEEKVEQHESDLEGILLDGG